jgi:anti-sigma factor RsiW
MKTRAQLVALRRQRLVAECAMQRAALTLHMEPVAQSLTPAAIGLRIAQRVRRHPGWLAVLGLGLAIVRPVRLSQLLRAGTNGLRLFQQVTPLLQQLAGPHDMD